MHRLCKLVCSLRLEPPIHTGKFYGISFFLARCAIRQAGVYFRSRLSEFERRHNLAFGLRIPGVGGGKIRNFIILRVFILLRADSTLYMYRNLHMQHIAGCHVPFPRLDHIEHKNNYRANFFISATDAECFRRGAEFLGAARNAK